MRFRALIAVALLGAFSAWADWAYLSVPGTPTDLHMADAGFFVVASTTQAQVVSCPQGGTCAIVMSPSTLAPVATVNTHSAALAPTNCLFSVTVGGNFSGCVSGTTNMISGAHSIRCTGTGFCGLNGTNAGAIRYDITYPPMFGAFNLSGAGAPGTTLNAAPGVIDLDGVDYSFIPVLLGMQLTVDAGTVNPIPGLSVAPDSVSAFVSARGSVGLFVTQPSTPHEHYGTDVSLSGTTVDAGWSLQPFSIDPQIGDLLKVAYVEIPASTHGTGFGMATQRSGGPLVAGPIPNPITPAVNWVARVGQPDAGGAFADVQCLNGQFCAAILAVANPGLNVVAYWNASPPSVAAVTAMISETGAGQMALATASDPDGDPTFITWVDDGGAIGVDSSTAGVSGTTPTLFGRATTGTACSSMVDVGGVISDGYAPHDTPFSTPVPFTLTSVDSPGISPPTATAIAGGPPLTFTASVSATGCGAGNFTWRLQLPDAGSIVPAGATVVYTPPAHYCLLDGGDVLTATDMNTAESAPTVRAIPIVPWGAPDLPTLDGGDTVTQLAGTTDSYGLAPTGNHVCEQSAGFPGLVFVLDAGVVASQVSFTADSVCTNEMETFRVQTEVAGEQNGRVSAPATITVNVIPDLSPLAAPVPFTMGFNFDGEATVNGTFDATASCLPERGLAGFVEVFREDGGLVAQTLGNPVPSPWSLQLPGICAGGSFGAVGLLFQDGGIIGSDDAGFFRPSGVVNVGDLSASTLPVSCAGLDSPVTVNDVPLVDGGCPLSGAASVLWSQTSGVSLEPAMLEGVTVQAHSTRSLAELIGEMVSWSIVADNGAGQQSSKTDSVVLVDHFVTVDHTLTRENADALVTVQVHVTSSETCDVQDVVLHEQPVGLTVIDGTAHVDRDPLGSSRDGGELDLGPFTLAAGQTRVVTYAVRVPLLATPAPVGDAWIKQTSVTIAQVPRAPPDACGCGSSPVAGLLIAASLVMLRARRRRR